MAKKKGEVEEKDDLKEDGEEEEKSSGLLSDDALDAFEDASPTGLEEEEILTEDDDELGELDFTTSDEW